MSNTATNTIPSTTTRAILVICGHPAIPATTCRPVQKPSYVQRIIIREEIQGNADFYIDEYYRNL
jgi:hypothetical protein